MTGREIVEMYRLLAIAKYEERYVIPTAYEGEAHQLEELACSLDVDGGPGMVGSGPFGEGSGSPMPVSVETFHALRDRQTSDRLRRPRRTWRPDQPAQLGRQGSPARVVPAAPRGDGGPGRHHRTQRGDTVLGRPGLAGDAAMNSAHDQAVVLQAASVCLQYPDDTVLARLPLVRRAVDELPGGAARERLTAFLDAAAATAPARMAQHYVEVFDTRRRCCLYLTWWTDGETRRRGSALAALKARYRAAGVELDTPELPDFLPAVLEFAATADLAAGLATAARAPGGHRAAAPGPARCRHPLRGARRGGLRAAAGTVARRRRRGESPGPQRTTAGAGRARARTVLAGTGGRNPMNALDVLLWGVLPYVMVAVLVGGTIWRYRYDKFGWTTRSSELYESRLLRIGSPLFHFGLLVVIVGHVIGLIIPKSWTDAVGLSQEAYHVQALLLGAVAGFSTLIGVGILVYRRRTTGPVFMATTRNDKLMYAVLVAAIVVGLATTLLGAAGGEEHNYRLTVSPWFRSLFVLQPDVAAMSQSGLAFQLHTLIGMGLFAIWPFTRLVHAFTAPVHYLFRPYIVYRTRQGGAAARPDRRGWERSR